MSIKAINHLLQSLGQRDRVGNLALGNNGCAGMALADGTSLYFEWNEPQQALHLYTPLNNHRQLALTGGDEAKLYRALLNLNCLSPGPVVAMHPQHPQVYLQMRFSAHGLDVETLDAAINELTASRNSARQHLASQGLRL